VSSDLVHLYARHIRVPECDRRALLSPASESSLVQNVWTNTNLMKSWNCTINLSEQIEILDCFQAASIKTKRLNRHVHKGWGWSLWKWSTTAFFTCAHSKCQQELRMETEKQCSGLDLDETSTVTERINHKPHTCHHFLADWTTLHLCKHYPYAQLWTEFFWSYLSITCKCL